MISEVLAVLLFAASPARGDVAARFGRPVAEVFLLEQNMRLTVSYDGQDRVCSYRVETREHSRRTVAALTDSRFWIDAAVTDGVMAELVPAGLRRGAVKRNVTELRAGEQMVVEADEAVVITRIQRTRRPLGSDEAALADRLVTIAFLGTHCVRRF